MKKIILTILMVLSLATIANANSGCSNINVAGLSQAEVEELRLECQTRVVERSKNISSAIMKPDKPVEETIKQWSVYGQFAKEIAQAIGILAKELNMEINNFLKSDAGMLAIILLVWKIAGVGIYNTVMGIALLIFSTVITTAFLNRVWEHEITYEKVQKWYGEKVQKIVKYEPFGHLSSDSQGFIVIAMIVVTIFDIIIIANVFF